MLHEVSDVSSCHVVPEGHHVGDGGPPVLAHPPTTARAVRLDGDVSCGKAGIVWRALVGVAEVVGTHEARHTVVPGQGEGLGDTPYRQASVITAITETETVKQRQTQTQRERERNRDRQTDRDRDRETETNRQTDRDRDRETETNRQTETEIEKQRQTNRRTETSGRPINRTG